MGRVWAGIYTSTSGLRRTTGRRSKFALRFLGFALAVTLGAFLVLQMDTNIWLRQTRLREGFAAIKTEKFYFGVNFRVNLRKLVTSISDFNLSGSVEDKALFEREAKQLQAQLKDKAAKFVSPTEREAFHRLEKAYDDFLIRVQPVQSTGLSTPLGAKDFASAYAQIRREADPVFQACEEVVNAEQTDFGRFMEDSENTLHSLQRLFAASLVLLLVLGVTLTIVVYRGMLAPLRAKLTESESIIERQEKLAALGALGAGVAHEIRNPLTAIKFRLFSLKKRLPGGLVDSEDVSVLSEEISRLDRIVREFLQFARPADPQLVRVPADRILNDVYHLMKPELEPAAIELKLETLEALWIQADTQQLKQVLINLIQNSADSIGRNGRILLRVAKTNAGLGEGSLKRSALLQVADTGKGIPPEVQKRLFDPFFTTKENGTGLGLAIAARIIEKHGGILRYETEVNHGTTFEILLPLLEDYGIENITY